jgi:1-aminocyclopropane-1-carboxylate deaminase/D-cysteine desulfhydrase-like pyridoxal-dependent ACC family enzyme
MLSAELVQEIDMAAATIQSLSGSPYDEGEVRADVLRLDRIHSVISGNKWFKLKYFLEEAKNGIISFGGAYSNHIVACAYAAARAGIPAIGFIRGEEHHPLSPSLAEARRYGMQLQYLSRADYQHKESPAFIHSLAQRYPGYRIIPEGGAGDKGIQGAAEILKNLSVESYTHLLAAVGTGTMVKGLALGALPHQQVIGISVLKGMEPHLPVPGAAVPVLIETSYHWGGYARKAEALLDFMNHFYRTQGIPTDFVYTGKLMFALTDLLSKGYFPPGSRILAIHSGGLQGNRSLPAGRLLF